MFRAFCTHFVWLLQNSQDQEGLGQFHDSIFSPASSRQRRYTFILGEKKKIINQNLLLTHHGPCWHRFQKATNTKVDRSVPRTNTHSKSSPKQEALAHRQFSPTICSPDASRANPGTALAVLLLDEGVGNRLHAVLRTDENHGRPSADHESQLARVFRQLVLVVRVCKAEIRGYHPAPGEEPNPTSCQGPLGLSRCLCVVPPNRASAAGMQQ